MFTFPGQREDEEVLCLIHKHPIVYVKIMAAFVLVAILPVALFLAFWLRAYPIVQYADRAMIVGIFACLYLLFALLFVCIRWINEEFDVFIVTTDRLIDITQISFLKRDVATTPLEQIQDTTGQVHGILPTILQYGNLHVQTAAGTASEFYIDRIPDPEGWARKILDWAQQKRDGKQIKIMDLVNPAL